MTMRLPPLLAMALLTCVVAAVFGGCGGGGSPAQGPGSPTPPTAETFNQARGFNAPVLQIVPVADGSGDVFVAGDFTVYQDVVVNRFVRLHRDGTIAQSFGDGFDGSVQVVAPATDGTGNLYVLGSFSRYNGEAAPGLLRLHRDGSRDAAFQVAAFNARPGSLVPAQDGTGDVYVSGGFTSYGGVPIRHLARLRADGTLNRTFNPGSGFAGIGDTFAGPAVLAVEGRSTGRLYAGGPFVAYIGVQAQGLVRIFPDGSPDPTFVASINVGTGGVEILMPAADGTADLYIGGQLPSYNGTPLSSGLIRVDEQGTLNRSFAPPTLTPSAIAPVGLGSQDLYVGGTTAGTHRLLRLRPDGSVAPTFQDPQPLNDLVLTIAPAVDATGDVYAGGAFTTCDGIGVNSLARLKADGTLHPTTVTGSGLSHGVLDLESTGDGGIYVATTPGYYNGTAISDVVRLRRNGQVDPSFRFGSIRQRPDDEVFVSDLSRIRGDDRLYVAGDFVTYNGQPATSVLRLLPDGSLDRSFSTGSGFHLVGGGNVPDVVLPVQVAPDGKGNLYVFGLFNRYNGAPVNNLVRLRSDGTLDSSFMSNIGFDDTVSMVVQAEDGVLYVSGIFTTINGAAVPRVIRVDPTGNRDLSFVPPPTVLAQAATQDGSAGLYVTSVDNRVMKLRRDGSVDPSFSSAPLPGVVIKLHVQDANHLIAVGGGPSGGYIVRLDQTGRVDPSLASGTGTDDAVVQVVDAADGTGDVYIGGRFTRYQNHTMQRVGRLTAAGVPD